ncbi:MAG: hypothetical protein SGJ20_11165 [Planctomycetota bacterium]|nr:hypothetical protein [Planctomycetota bacterium]
MSRFPYITDYINDVFAKEQRQWDFILLRPLLLVAYFFLRVVIFPLQFVLHRRPFGCEAFLIDRSMAFGMKYLARHDAAELLLRHVQIEPLLYRHILARPDLPPPQSPRKLNGIDGDYGVENLKIFVKNNPTIGHDLLSYELLDRFDKDTFLANLDYIRSIRPVDHEQLSKAALEENRKHSFQLLGATNIVLLIVTSITLFGDLRTTITALNSFRSDSVLLWCLKRIYSNNQPVLTDLDFFMQEVSNRGHFNNSAFFSNPSQYLYYHLVFDEVAYDLLRNRPPQPNISLPADAITTAD